MARVDLDIGDSANRLTLRMILEADGHVVTAKDPEVLVTDRPESAVARAGRVATLILTGQSEVGEAVRAMRHGVYGYVLIPLQAGEAEVMVRRAAESRRLGTELAGPSPQRPESLAKVEARHIRHVLRYCRNNRAKAARILGIGRNTLWRKLKEMGEKDSSN